ncbi:MAG TPA: hypothetical protein VM165_02305, partial [Planctomycetaceae bacterium]|nr:hypothetical protein [Planctomycetaceae bacterium]
FLILLLKWILGAADLGDRFHEREWWLLFFTAILPAGAVGWWYHSHPRPVPDGHCPSCGYDCRATRERCPECGTRQRR